MKHHTRHKILAGGFGAIELVIVVIILGGIFLLTLKGTSMIAPVRARMIVHQIQEYQSMVLRYQVDYGTLPGDDSGAAARWQRPDALFPLGVHVVSYADDGRINGLLDDSAAASGEQYMAWTDLRLGGYVEGDPTLIGQTARPENMFGGAYGFAEDNLGLDQVLCLTRVPGREAELIDKNLDDGKVATGRLRGTSLWDPVERKNHFPAPDAAPYNTEKTYIICIPVLP
jgi:type II secretory pathway pseudopilin PulG